MRGSNISKPKHSILPLRRAYQTVIVRLKEGGIAELGSGFITLGWGSFSLRTEPLPAWHSLDLLLRIAPHNLWGWIETVLGFSQLIGFWLVDRSWPRPWLRFSVAVLTTALWALITISSLQSDVALAPWDAAFGGIFLMNWLLVVRIFDGHG